MRKLLFLVAAAAAGAALADGGDEVLVEQRKNPWHLTVGPVMSPRVRVKVHGPRRFAFPLTVPSSTSGGAGAAGPADPSAGFVDRQYADGYVKPDEGTADGDSMTPGLTWNWGADDLGSQHSGGRVNFHSEMSRWSESVSSSSYRKGGSGLESERDILFGLEMMGGWMFFENKDFDASIDAGFRFYGSGDLKSESKYGTSVRTTRSEYRYVDSYDASGWTDNPSGSYTGTESGPGRLIGATPTRSEELMSSSGSSVAHSYRARTRLNYTIWDLRLGPTAGWKATKWLTIRGGVYGLLGLVDARLRTSMETPDGAYGARKSVCDVVFGAAAGLFAQIDLTDRLFLVGAAEYDWWSDVVDIHAGGADARIKLGDMSVSLALGMEF